MGKGVRLSKQNYCCNCNFRIKNSKGNTICKEYNRTIDNAMVMCRLLKPFDKYYEFKN